MKFQIEQTKKRKSVNIEKLLFKDETNFMKRFIKEKHNSFMVEKQRQKNI